jgi:DNA-binding MarR family transcriptional regulator
MPRNVSADDATLLRAERDIRDQLGDRPLDFASMQAIANIYRAASAVRRRAEREVLADAQLSWGGFTILWVLWVWGDMETGLLADECDLSKGTLTGMLTTLERRDLVVRERIEADRRRMLVSLTVAGRELIDGLFTRFNSFEGEMADRLSDRQKRQLASLLRVVIANADAHANDDDD